MTKSARTSRRSAHKPGQMEFAQADGHNSISELYYMLQGIAPGALLVSLVSLAIMLLW